MPFPTGWPPRVPSGVKSIRFYVSDTTTANFQDRAYLFSDPVPANPFKPLPVVPPGMDVSDPAFTPTDVPEPPIGTGQNDPGDPHPMIWAETICILNYGATKIFFSFDGVNNHGEVPPLAGGAPGTLIMRNRREAGIAVNGAGNNFAIMAW